MKLGCGRSKLCVPASAAEKLKEAVEGTLVLGSVTSENPIV
jgi:hypothetical protein